MTDLISTRIDATTTPAIRSLLAARDRHIANNPHLNVRWQHAQEQLHDLDDAVVYAGLHEISNVLREAVEAVGGVRR